MKKTLFLLAAFVVALSLSAQNNADLLTSSAVQLIDVVNRAGIKGPIIVGTGEFPVATGPAVSPRTVSPPASAARRTTSNTGGIAKIDTLPNGDVIGPNWAIFGGVTYVPDGNGGWKQAIPQQQPAQQQVPNPANNTGTATAGVTVVPTLGDLYDVLPDGRIVAVGNVRVEPAPGVAGGAGATASTGGGGKFQKMQIAPNEILFNEETGEVALLDRRRERLRTNRGYGVGTSPEEDHQPNTWPNAMAARFSSIDGSGSAMSGGMFVGGGAYCGGQTVVYNQRPPAVATYGVRGGDCWRPQWRR